MKKFIKLATILLTISILFTGCSNKNMTDSEKFKDEYESLNNTKREKDNKTIRSVSIPDDNPMVYASAKDITKMIDNKESFVVYFGFSDCPWCRSVIEELIKVANDEGLDKIYYVDVKDIRDVKELDGDEVKTVSEGTKYYYELLERMDEVLDDYTLTNEDGEEVSTGEKRIYAPNVVSVVGGHVKELETGISEKLEDPYDKLTDEMKKETYGKFKCNIKCVLESSNSCTSKSAC